MKCYDSLQLLCSAPEENILALKFFALFINDLLMFLAPDSKNTFANVIVQEVVTNVEIDLAIISSWADKNGFIISTFKCEAMIVLFHFRLTQTNVIKISIIKQC